MSRFFNNNRFNKLLVKSYQRKLFFKNNFRLSSHKQSSGKEIVISNHCKPAAAYSAATKANGNIFISGQLGLDPNTSKFVSDDVEGQAKQALTNLKGIVEDAGSNLNNVVKTTVLLSDINHFQAVNTVYSDFFKANNVTELPARSCYAVKDLPLGAKIEIEAFAVE